MPDSVILHESIDTHTHPRDMKKHGDGRMETLMPLLAAEHETIVAIGNCQSPVLDLPSARAWKRDILSCIPPEQPLCVLIAALVTDRTPPGLVQSLSALPDPPINLLKIFFEKVSNDGGNSVSDLKLIDDTIAATYQGRKHPIHIMIHAERKYDQNGNRIEMRDREWYCIKHDIEPMLERHPHVEITIAHVSDGRTVAWIREMRRRGFMVWGEIATHYLVRCHEDLYEGRRGGTAFQANDLCWPLYKNEASMTALQVAALDCEDIFHFGSDFACHKDDPTQASGVKIDNDGEACGGVTILPAHGKSLLIDFFAENGKLETLNAYISGNARAKLRLPPAPNKVRYIRSEWQVPQILQGDGFSSKPFMRGKAANWIRVAW